MSENDYVLITAAYNEAEHIGSTVEAVLKQSIKPNKWIVVSDGSTDSTDAIIRQYAERYSFIEFIRREKLDNEYGFISKVAAIHVGYEALNDIPYRFIGILDADITFGPDYYESVISRFHENTTLGITGGFIYELKRGQFKNRPTNTDSSVAGSIQLFRRECYEAIGGHRPARYGGEDWICEIMSRTKGWGVRSFPDIVVRHHKQGQSKRGVFRDAFRQGRMDYTIGSHVIFEMVKCLRRVHVKPYFVHSILRMSGFIVSFLIRDPREVPKEAISYLQGEQLERIKQSFRTSKLKPALSCGIENKHK